MTATDQTTTIVAIAARAFELMTEHGIAPLPRNFEIWFAYASETNPDLTIAINAIIDRQQAFTDEISADLYEQFYGISAMGDMMGEVGERMRAQLDDVVDFVTRSAKDTSDYGETLSGMTGQLSSLSDGTGSDTTIMDQLLAATRKMASRTKELESKLQSSSHEISQLRNTLDSVRIQSVTDPLTGLANRRRFDEALVQALETSAQGLCLLMCDVDHFKKINDTYGHQTGDQILKLVAQCLKKVARDDDITARYGGEEFALILPGTTVKNALAVAERARRSVEAVRIVKRSTGEALGPVTISIGLATAQPEDTPVSLIERADACLYAAKQTGRNRVMSENEPSANRAAAG